MLQEKPSYRFWNLCFVFPKNSTTGQYTIQILQIYESILIYNVNASYMKSSPTFLSVSHSCFSLHSFFIYYLYKYQYNSRSRREKNKTKLQIFHISCVLGIWSSLSNVSVIVTAEHTFLILYTIIEYKPWMYVCLIVDT